MLGSLTNLEAAVLAAVRERLPEATESALRIELTRVRAWARENTGHGFFTDFAASADDRVKWTRAVDAPAAHMVGLGTGVRMMFILFCVEDLPLFLEGFQIGDGIGEDVDLSPYRLEDLRFSHLEWADTA